MYHVQLELPSGPRLRLRRSFIEDPLRPVVVMQSDNGLIGFLVALLTPDAELEVVDAHFLEGALAPAAMPADRARIGLTTILPPQ